MRTYEDIVFFPKSNLTLPYSIEMAGISYCDPSYHMHRKNSNVYVFEYIIKGKGYINHNGQKFLAKEGDVYILKEGYDHDYYADYEDPWTKIWFNISGSLIGHLLEDYKLNLLTVIEDYNDDTLFLEYLNIAKDKSLSDSEILGKTILIIHKLIYDLYLNSPLHQKNNAEAHKIKKYIDNHIDRIVSINELSNIIFLSPSRTIQIFKKAYNITPYEYALNKKIEIAKMLLVDSKISINEISEKLGFCDPHHFSNYFKKNANLSPKNYRNSKIK